MKQSFTFHTLEGGVLMPHTVTVIQNSLGEWYSDHFSPTEFRCKCDSCKKQKPHVVLPRTVAFCEFIRVHVLKRPTTLTSGHRCTDHPVEARKIAKGKQGGMHSRVSGTYEESCAVDVGVSGTEAYEVQGLAYINGFGGVAYSKKFGFIHIDDRHTVPVTWNYTYP